MIYIICSIVLIILIASFIRSSINIRRQIHFNAMNSMYDKMEVYVYTNNLQNKKEIISYIAPFKNYVINTGYADIEILMASLTKMMKDKTFETRKKQYAELLDSIPEELKIFAKEFDLHLNKAIFLSVFRSEFILYFLRQLTISLFKALYRMSFKYVKSFFKIFKEVFKNENILANNGFNQVNPC